MNTPDESARRVLEGVLGQKKMTFSEFRKALYDEHPTFLSDDEIHDLYLKHYITDQTVPLARAEVDLSDFINDLLIGPPRQMLGPPGTGPGSAKANEDLIKARLEAGRPQFHKAPPGTPKSRLVQPETFGTTVRRKAREVWSILRGTHDA